MIGFVVNENMTVTTQGYINQTNSTNSDKHKMKLFVRALVALVVNRGQCHVRHQVVVLLQPLVPAIRVPVGRKTVLMHYY